MINFFKGKQHFLFEKCCFVCTKKGRSYQNQPLSKTKVQSTCYMIAVRLLTNKYVDINKSFFKINLYLILIFFTIIQLFVCIICTNIMALQEEDTQ